MQNLISKCLCRAVAVLALLVYPLAARGVEPVKPPPPPQAGKSPLKVFVLAGQSNMEGQGIIDGAGKGTLETLVKDPASAARFKHLVDKNGKWAVRDDVWCAYGSKGALTVGGFAASGCIGPELGFGWHQGWQDGCAQPMADEYESNMVNFIRDVRKDLGVPDLPFVIGGSGFGGWEQKVTRRLQISAALQAAAQHEEFKGNVLYVETRGFFRPHELSPHGFGYHWNGNAETYYPLGYGHFAADDWNGAATNSPIFAPVGSFKPNAFGLDDMHGNVLEWCQDFYAPYPPGAQTDPTGPATGGKNIQRGGGWHSSAEKCRSARRYQAGPSRAFNRDGFRVMAADVAGGVPPARLEQLTKGINLSCWFSQADSYSNQHLDTYNTAKDAALIKAMGFRHVRFAFNDATVVDSDNPAVLNPAKMRRFDAAIDMLSAAGLAVIVDFHPEDEYKLALEKDDASVARFVAMWRALAKHLAPRDPERVFLEAMNEPMIRDSARWNAIQNQVLSAMRESAPRHTLIATAAEWSEIYKLELTDVVADRNVVYNFHCYEPFKFTHQDAPWVGELAKGLKNVPYPSSPEAVARVLADLPDAKARHLMIEYGNENWNAGKVDALIASAAAWGHKHGVALTCNEFGVIHSAPAADRNRCIGDVRKALEKYHIGWAMWDYAGGFNVATGEPGQRVADAATAKALGLTPVRVDAAPAEVSRMPIERDNDGMLVPGMSYAKFLDRSYRLVMRDLDGWATGNAYTDADGKPVPGYINYALVNPKHQLGVGHPLNADTVYPAFHHALYIRAFLAEWQRTRDPQCLARARQLAEWNLARRTPADCLYGSLFYSTVSKGKVGGNVDGDAVMTDKPAIMALAMLELAAATGEARYREAAIAVANTLAKTQLPEGNWPFRVNPISGEVREAYTSSAIYAVMLFEALGQGTEHRWDAAKAKALQWILDGPAKTMLWKGFYEDISAETGKTNRTNWDCIDTARWLVAHRAENPEYLPLALKLHDWIAKEFVEKAAAWSPAEGLREQKCCFATMGVHTMHWAALLADLHLATGELPFKRRAINSCAMVTYWMRDDGANLVGPTWGDEIWFSCHFGSALYLYDTLSHFPELDFEQPKQQKE